MHCTKWLGLFLLTVNLFTGGEQLCRRERLRSCRRGWEGGGKEREQQGRSTWAQESKPYLRLFCYRSIWSDSDSVNLPDISWGGRGSAAATATTKPAPRRATRILIQTQIPTALINPRRRKRWKTRMMRKRRAKVGSDTDVAYTFMVPFLSRS